MKQQKSPPKRERKKQPIKPPPPPPPTVQTLVPVGGVIAKTPEIHAGVVGRMPSSVTLSLDLPEDSRATQYLRVSAGLAYTTDIHGVSLRELSERQPFVGVVTLRQLERWSAEDNWVNRRRDILDNWRRVIEAKVGSEVVRKRVEDLMQMDTLAEKAMAKLESRLKAQSWEGVAQALIKLWQLRDQYREKIAAELIPAASPQSTLGGSSPLGALPKPKFSVDEVRAAAHAVMAQRRAQMRATAAQMATDAKKAEGKG